MHCAGARKPSPHFDVATDLGQQLETSRLWGVAAKTPF